MDILIATIFRIPHVGGLSTHVQLLIDGLRKRGHNVRLIDLADATCARWQKGLLFAASGFNRDAYRAAVLRFQLSRLERAVRREVRRSRPDVIHCHDAMASFGAAEARSGVPLVQTVHGPMLYEVRSTLGTESVRYLTAIERAERAAFERVDRFITVDSGQARILVEDYGVDARRIDVVFNCVDEKEVRELASRPPSLDLPPRYFLVPRRLVPKTGVRFAIEAMAKLKDPAIQLLIAGDGPQRGELEQLTSRLNLASRVRFLGGIERAKLMPLFGRAEAVVIPSIPSEGVIEATSLAVTEAMAAGTVPVASAIGGLAELIRDDSTGLLVPPGDPTALAGALQRLLDEPGLRERLVVAATDKVEKDYSLSAWLDSAEGVYGAATRRTTPGSTASVAKHV